MCSPVRMMPTFATTAFAGPMIRRSPGGAVSQGGPVGDVGDHSLGLAAPAADVPNDLVEGLGLDVPAADPVAQLSETPRVRRPHAAGGAGHPDGPWLAHHAPARVAGWISSTVTPSGSLA